MVALDQRQSLATMFDAAGRSAVQEELDGFRAAAARLLMPHASAILLEKGFLERAGIPLLASATCGRIVAVDRLIQSPGKPVEDSAIDRDAFPIALSVGAHAVKLLVVWAPGRSNDERIALVREFIELAHGMDLLALVECIVQRNPDGSLPSADEYLGAARELSRGADIYKAQVPIHSGEDDASIEQLARAVTATIACPWVVLSTGITPDDFPRTVTASCRGGASGFLAGRAIWGPSIHAGDTDDHLEEVAVAQLAQLARIVDANGRPWNEALAAPTPR
jgi:sulfofructosephosphate aldolase